MKAELLIYVIRPDGTALWMPDYLALSLGVYAGDRLTNDQYSGKIVQRLLEDRAKTDGGEKKKQ